MPADLSLIERLRRTNVERGLLNPGDCVLVAVSGGPDSLALLHALRSLRDAWNIELVAAHLIHGMRGEAGEADAAFVRETGRAWGIPVEIGSRDVPALARRTGLSLEEAGRAARYRFFGRAARRAGCRVVATGHTADDRVETVLLHLFRGTGLDGLAGIPARRSLRAGRPSLAVVRPLIDVTRAQVLEYCAAHHLQPRHDATNDSPAFLRNRVRRELLPLLEAGYSPALRRRLLRLSELAVEETALLNAQGADLMRRALSEGSMGDFGPDPAPTPCPPTPKAGGGGQGVGAGLAPRPLHLSRAVLTEAPRALARRALRLAVQSIQPGSPPDLATVERLLSLVNGERPGFTLPGGEIAARLTVERLILEQADPVRPFVPEGAATLTVPGTTPLPWAGGAISARLLGVEDWGMGPDGAPFLRFPTPNTQYPTPNQALLDGARLAGALTVRPPRPGDRIQPLGMAGHRKLQDLLTDRKAPRSTRRHLPIVSDAERIVWVAGYCVSQAAKVTAGTREALLLVWESDVRRSDER